MFVVLLHFAINHKLSGWKKHTSEKKPVQKIVQKIVQKQYKSQRKQREEKTQNDWEVVEKKMTDSFLKMGNSPLSSDGLTNFIEHWNIEILVV